MNADISRCIDDRSSTSRSLCSRRRWKKHIDKILPICWIIDSSPSKMTPRSQTECTGSMTTEPKLRLVSSWLSLVRFDRESNHISSVLSGLRCNRRDKHQSPRYSTQSSSRRWCSATVSRHMWVSNCESSAYRWWLTANLSMVSNMSSVYTTNSFEPKTEPYGTLHVRATGPGMSFDVENVSERPVWYDWNQSGSCRWSPNCLLSMPISMLWSTVSKAALRSRNTNADARPESVEMDDRKTVWD